MLTIWCVTHRSNLAFESLQKDFVEVHRTITDVIALASYFHSSGCRTSEIMKLAADNDFNYRRLPKYFEVRFAEFTFTLFESILSSLRALVKYMEESKDSNKAARQGFLRNLTDLNRLKLMCLLADVLIVFLRYQKKLQSNSLTLFELKYHCDGIKSDLDEIKKGPLVGGWEVRNSVVLRSVLISWSTKALYNA